jgi:4-diphosphocytidyl-2-C-methyl-D-erythritol kinase
MVSFPHCKINLGLQVISKRADGYHNIETCFYPVPWTDILEVIPSDKLNFQTSGNSIPGNDADNLCVKAYRLLEADYKIPPVQIHLHKIIPTGAGLGGGSSDGAFTLRLLDRIFNLNLSVEVLKKYASMLGSDCAFFVEDKPMFATGRGEILTDTPVTLRGKFIVIVKPEIHMSTAEVYNGVQPKAAALEIKTILENTPIAGWKDALKNEFEENVFKTHPQIKGIKDKLYNAGALYASMSGSGSAVYGIFDFQKDIASEFPELTVWSRLLD